MSKTPKKKPATKGSEKTGVMSALHPEPKSTAAGRPDAKAGAKSAKGKAR